MWRTLRRAVLAVGGLLVAGAVSRTARADAFPKVREGVYGSAGATLGAAFHERYPTGFFAGAEASALWWEPDGANWLGLYADGVYDFGSDSFRHSVGPEFGVAFLGVEAGFLGEVRDGDYHPGFVIRGMLTLAVVGVYGGFGKTFGGEEATNQFGELGLLLKIPFPIAVDETRRQPGGRWEDAPPPPAPPKPVAAPPETEAPPLTPPEPPKPAPEDTPFATPP